ncbi:MAG: hypothetical protein ABI333_23020 [bacterium]
MVASEDLLVGGLVGLFCLLPLSAGCSGEEPPSCGDGVCAPSESPQSCAADCAVASCGDGQCDAWESVSSCPSDCEPGGVCDGVTCSGRGTCVEVGPDPTPVCRCDPGYHANGITCLEGSFVVWTRVHHVGPDDTGEAVAVDPSGDVLVAGTHDDSGVVSCSLIHLDGDGNVLTAPQWPDCRHDSIAWYPAGGWIIGGSSREQGFFYPTLAYRDANLEQVWTWRTTEAPGSLLALGILSDGTIATGGSSGAVEFLVLDTAGATALSSGTVIPGSAGTTHGIVIDAADDIVVVGSLYPSAGETQWAMGKFDRVGQSQWSLLQDPIENRGVAAVDVDTQANIYVCGRDDLPDSEVNAWVARYSPDGDEQWTRFYPDAACSDLAVTPDGEVVAVGGIPGAGEDEDFWALRLTAQGAEVWTRVWGEAGEDFLRGVAVDPQGDLLVTGHSVQDPEGRNLVVVRLMP